MSPFLFLWQNLEVLNSEVNLLSKNLLENYAIDKNSLFLLPDNWEAIKIKEMRDFLSKWNEKPRFKFQIFLIENISRMTVQSANAALKFFEEPWKWNIIFLTNTSESDVLETILSRVQIERWEKDLEKIVRQEYFTMIEKYHKKGDIEIISYLFSEKLERKDYEDFLYAIFSYISKNPKFLYLLDELEADMQWIEKNNLNGKYLVDKYLLYLGKK